MYRKMPLAISILVCAILVGLIGHGTELFYKVEGGESADLSAQVYAFIKAFGFPFAIESGNAIALFVGFNPNTRGGLTRFVAFLIGTGCFITSCLIQYHYFRYRIDADWWYAGVLPGLVALLSALAGLLDRDLAIEAGPQQEEITQVQQSKPQPAVDVTALIDRAQAALERRLEEALEGLTEYLEEKLEAITARQAEAAEAGPDSLFEFEDVSSGRGTIISDFLLAGAFEQGKVAAKGSASGKLSTADRRADIAHRLDRGEKLTQSELAAFYGVTRQAISYDLKVITGGRH